MSEDVKNELVEDIHDVEQIQESEELVDETQVVESNEEEVLEAKKVKEEGEDESDEDESDEDEVEVKTTQTEMPKTKAGIVTAAYDMLKKAKKEDAQKIFAGMLKVFEGVEIVDGEGFVTEAAKKAGKGKAEIDVDFSGSNADAKKAEKKHKLKIQITGDSSADISGQKKDIVAYLSSDVYDMDREDQEGLFPELFESATADVSHIDYQEDLDVMVAEEATLSDGFRQKAGVIFESALKTKVAGEVDRLEAEYATSLEEEVSEFQFSMVEKVDSYLNYVVETWLKDNELAVTTGLKTEIAEGFMTSLQAVFKEHYIEVPEGKENMIDELAEQVSELEESLNKSTEDNIQLHEANQAFAKSAIIKDASSGMVVTEAEKLASLVEDIDFDNAETFQMKVNVIKESYFVAEIQESVDEANSLIGEDTVTVADLSDTMARYTQAITNNLTK